jgi:hypothetical protein
MEKKDGWIFQGLGNFFFGTWDYIQTKKKKNEDESYEVHVNLSIDYLSYLSF